MAGLGKGFDALIPTDFDPSLLIDSKDRIQILFISRVKPNPDQPRRHFDQNALNELAASLKQFGVLQPLIVSPQTDGNYRIIAGERRWRAAQIAGLTEVPAIIREPKEIEELEIALIENVQRVDLSPLEQAISIERLHQQFNLTYREIAGRLAKAETTVSNLVRLLQLPEDARQALAEGKISEGHARAILALKATPELQTELLELIIKNTWSVRQAEQFVNTHKQGIVKEKAIKEHMATETAETKQISKKLQTPVSLRRTAKGGRLELHFKTDEELQNLLDLLNKL
jgi:ParB family transcriptional regulator, chromosome partitioning protein